jgi:hypothetical protein
MSMSEVKHFALNTGASLQVGHLSRMDARGKVSMMLDYDVYSFKIMFHEE